MSLTKIETTHKGYGSKILDFIEKESPELVCIDYFDTLVHRTVAPEDVKKIACERVARVISSGKPGQVLGAELYTLRQGLEQQECERNAALGLDLECSAVDVWSRIWDADFRCHTLSQQAFAALATRIELDIECQVQQPDEEMLQLLVELQDTGTRLVLISDFYLPPPYYSSMLSHHGLLEAFSAVYISCESGLTKRSGRLFEKVSRELGVALDRIVMIGDNPYSDGDSPNALGMHAIVLDRTPRQEYYHRRSVESDNYGAIANSVMVETERSSEPFINLAITLYLFIDSLYHSLQQAGAKDVFFMAREGQFLKSLFDHYQAKRISSPDSRADNKIFSHYLRVSRRATFLPSLRDLGSEDFHTLFRQYRRISVLEFLSSIGLEQSASEIAEEIPDDMSERQNDLPTSEVFSRLLGSEIFVNAYERARTERQNAFQKYIEQFGADLGTGELHLVDVGWKGTIQDNVRGILNQLPSPWPECKISGHYLGLVAGGSASRCNEKKGLLFSHVEGRSKNFHVFNENRALFEVALGADHGSAHTYTVDGDGVPQVLEGDFEERDLFEQKVRPLQTKLMQAFLAIDRTLAESHLPLASLKSLATRAHARMVWNPTRSEIEWFQDAYHVENFGVFESSRFDLSRSKPSIIEAVQFYLTLRGSPEKVDLGFWPWLKCYQRGGAFVASRYGRSQMKAIEE